MRNMIKFIPNSITMARIIMSILFVLNIWGQFVYKEEKFMNLIVTFLAICASDLLDGKIARKAGCTSIMGAKLDVFADVFFIVLSYVTLIILEVLPLWFLAFICIKFTEFLITSSFINNHNNSSKNPFIFDKIGRIVSAMFFIIPGMACIFKVLMPYNTMCLFNFFLYIILIAGLYSSYLRIKSCLLIHRECV